MKDAVRINKYLSESGVASRREADRMVEDGRVTIDGSPAVFGSKVFPESRVLVDGKPVKRTEKKVLLAFHKPRGIVCTTYDPKSKDVNIIDYIGYKSRIFPVGRLDKDSEGLILLTDDGDISDRIMKAKNFHEKEYQVRVDKKIDETFIEKMAAGVPILDTVTRPCTVRKTGGRSFTIILTQGLNRQIRRMCEYFGVKVTRLKRVRIMNIELGDLKVGEYRELTKKEYEELIKGLSVGDGKI